MIVITHSLSHRNEIIDENTQKNIFKDFLSSTRFATEIFYIVRSFL